MVIKKLYMALRILIQTLKRVPSVHFTKKIQGATLIESLTALAILTSVMGAAFVVYDKTMQHQNQVMKTKAKAVQTQFEYCLTHDSIPATLLHDDLNIEIEHEPYTKAPNVTLFTLTVNTTQGTKIIQKKYLKHQTQKTPLFPLN